MSSTALDAHTARRQPPHHLLRSRVMHRSPPQSVSEGHVSPQPDQGLHNLHVAKPGRRAERRARRAHGVDVHPRLHQPPQHARRRMIRAHHVQDPILAIRFPILRRRPRLHHLLVAPECGVESAIQPLLSRMSTSAPAARHTTTASRHPHSAQHESTDHALHGSRLTSAPVATAVRTIRATSLSPSAYAHSTLPSAPRPTGCRARTATISGEWSISGWQCTVHDMPLMSGPSATNTGSHHSHRLAKWWAWDPSCAYTNSGAWSTESYPAL